MKDRKNIVIIILVGIIVLLSCIIVNLLIGNDIDNNNITNKNLVKNVIENDEIKIIESSYVADEHEKDYTNITYVEIYKNMCKAGETEDLFVFSIVDNKLNVKNMNTNELYVSNKLVNIKSFVYNNMVYTGCGSDQIILLTNDGIIYKSQVNINTTIDEVIKVDDFFEKVELPVFVSEIGIIESLGPAAPQSLLIKDDEGNQYHMWGNDLAKLK